MKKNTSDKSVTATFTPRRLGLLLVAASLALASMPSPAKDRPKSDGYLQTNLVSDLPGIAQLQDTNLVNPWGISFSATSPFWISDNGSGLSTLYAVTNDSAGATHRGQTRSRGDHTRRRQSHRAVVQ